MDKYTFTFENTDDDRSALRAAQRFLSSHGYSYGSTQRDDPIAAMHGAWVVSKWRNLSPNERAESHAIITPIGDSFRTGGAKVTFREHAPVIPRKPKAEQVSISRLSKHASMTYGRVIERIHLQLLSELQEVIDHLESVGAHDDVEHIIDKIKSDGGVKFPVKFKEKGDSE